jgi:hypothetical protein
MHSDIASKQAVGFVGAFVPNAWIRAYTSRKKRTGHCGHDNDQVYNRNIEISTTGNYQKKLTKLVKAIKSYGPPKNTQATVVNRPKKKIFSYNNN